jgi:hypothetical protein
MSVLRAADVPAFQKLLEREHSAPQPHNELISWRRKVDAYPHISFADVFSQADSGTRVATVPSFTGKIVIMGSTAPSLHDIHPTPLSPMHAGVDSLATALDNALNQRRLTELPTWVQAMLAITLCVGLALWARFKGLASLELALFWLPFTLMFVSYLSLNGLPVFLDLHLAAALALLFLAVLRHWSVLRRKHWCALPEQGLQPSTIWTWERVGAWDQDALDRLIDAIERHAPRCRVVACGVHSSANRWPELARFATIVGPRDAMMSAHDKLTNELLTLAYRGGEPQLVATDQDREALAQEVLKSWLALQKATSNIKSRE